MWDTMVYLKLKCPNIDVKAILDHLESFMEQPEEQEQKQFITA